MYQFDRCVILILLCANLIGKSNGERTKIEPVQDNIERSNKIFSAVQDNIERSNKIFSEESHFANPWDKSELL